MNYQQILPTKYKMEIVNSKEIKRFVIIVSVIASIFTIIPLTLYFSKFGGNLADTQTEWETFGSFVGGTIGTLFNLIAVVFSFFSIYITLKIATRIHENEQKFNRDNIKRENELINKQNKPFPVVDFNRYPEKNEILLSNHGPGTLIITNMEILYEGKIYKDFNKLIWDKVFTPKMETIIYLFDLSHKHVISPGASKLLLEQAESQNEHDINTFEKFKEDCKAVLIKAKVKLYYEDIFENKFEIEESLEI